MRILQINKFLYPQGGTETYLLSLIKLLKQKKQGVLCFSQKNPKNISCAQDRYFIDNLDLNRFSFNTLLKLPRLFWSFKAQRLVKKLIADQRPDIVHIHNIYHQLSPSILPVFKQAGLPVVMTVHDFKLIAPNYALRADGKKLFHKNSLLIDTVLKLEFAWHKWLDVYRKNIDLFIAPSQFVKEKLLTNGFDAEKILVIPHFLSADFFATGISKKPAKKIPAKDKYILSYGRLDESKGFDDLLKAFAELKISGLKLKIAGAGPAENRLKKLIKDLGLAGQAELIGEKSQPEIIDLILNAKLIVNCSKLHETFGLTVLEAMALGKPVIASKVGAIPELITHGVNGWLYQPSDVGDLKKQLLIALSSEALRNKLAKAGQQTAKSFTAENHYRLLRQAYEQAVKRHLPPAKKSRHLLLYPAIIIIVLVLLIDSLIQIQISSNLTQTPLADKYPRLANLYWKNPVTLAEAPALAKWDLLVLDMQAQTNSAEAIKEIRRHNPDIIIIAYASANEMPTGRLKNVEPSGVGLWHDLASGDQAVWHLKTYYGQDVVFWPGNVLMNLGVKNQAGRTYADYLTDFFAQKIMASGLWDGIMFDNAWQTIDQINKNIDIDGDGQADNGDKINALWQTYYADFFRQLRARLGSQAILLGNGDGAYQAFLNGRMFEGFPEFWEGGWTGSIKKYQETETNGFLPRINIINSDTSNTGNRENNFQSMRFGLTSTLLFNGFFSFDYGTNLREQFWWYDEYYAKLGRPLGPAKNTLSADQEIKAGVWRRDFQHGLILVNSTAQPEIVALGEKYQKLLGSQDIFTNTGAIIDTIALPAQDGIILMRR